MQKRRDFLKILSGYFSNKKKKQSSYREKNRLYISRQISVKHVGNTAILIVPINFGSPWFRVYLP